VENNQVKITVETLVKVSIENAWGYWTMPEHIKAWNNASEDWHSPIAVNDLRVGGRFVTRMEAKDGSVGFDFSGKYDVVTPFALIAYTLDDERQVQITFTEKDGETLVVETFEAESENPIELQRNGWQSIIDNFKRYAEQH
jgi:uncharacterized protein YndB with AHSA1/START domain